MKLVNFLTLLLIFSCHVLSVNAQHDSIKQDVINNIPHILKPWYFYDADVKIISDSLKANYLNNVYSGTDLNEFAWQLTKDIRSISGQKHFYVEYRSYDLKPISKFNRRLKLYKIGNKIKFKRAKHLMKKDCFVYGQVEILPGNIGLLTINNLIDKSNNRNLKCKRFSSMARKFEKTDALIIDLRNNEGGTLQQVTHLLSFFVDEGDYLISNTRFQLNDSPIIFHHTTPRTKLKLKQKIYVLISNNTFSAGEITAYLFQRSANAILIGESTAGSGLGNNITNIYNSNFIFYIPSSNHWDTTNNSFSSVFGVMPDVKVNPDSAFIYAYKKTLENNGDFSEETYSKGLQKYSGKFDNLELQDDFGSVKIYKKKDQLFLKDDFASIQKLKKIADDTYSFKNIIVKFGINEEGRKTMDFYYKKKKINSLQAYPPY